MFLRRIDARGDCAYLLIHVRKFRALHNNNNIDRGVVVYTFLRSKRLFFSSNKTALAQRSRVTNRLETTTMFFS